MDIPLPDGVRRAAKTDWKQVTDITAEAFAEDPVNTWVFGGPDAIRSAFRVMGRNMYIPHGHCYLAEDAGATMWLPPGTEASFSTWTGLQFSFGQMRHGNKTSVPRAMKLGELMEKHHPKEPHMYLFTIGTRKTARGTGIGKKLISHVLEACDRKKIPAYLENSNPDNHGFYSSHGFERVTTFPVGDGGPIMEPMWREPR